MNKVYVCKQRNKYCEAARENGTCKMEELVLKPYNQVVREIQIFLISTFLMAGILGLLLIYSIAYALINHTSFDINLSWIWVIILLIGILFFYATACRKVSDPKEPKKSKEPKNPWTNVEIFEASLFLWAIIGIPMVVIMNIIIYFFDSPSKVMSWYEMIYFTAISYPLFLAWAWTVNRGIQQDNKRIIKREAMKSKSLPFAGIPNTRPCVTCGGTGKVSKGTENLECRCCQGKGYHSYIPMSNKKKFVISIIIASISIVPLSILSQSSTVPVVFIIIGNALMFIIFLLIGYSLLVWLENELIETWVRSYESGR